MTPTGYGGAPPGGPTRSRSRAGPTGVFFVSKRMSCWRRKTCSAASFSPIRACSTMSRSRRQRRILGEQVQGADRHRQVVVEQVGKLARGQRHREQLGTLQPDLSGGGDPGQKLQALDVLAAERQTRSASSGHSSSRPGGPHTAAARRSRCRPRPLPRRPRSGPGRAAGPPGRRRPRRAGAPVRVSSPDEDVATGSNCCSASSQR